MNNFLNILKTGYSLLFKDAKLKLMDEGPKFFTASGSGLMMMGSALIARESCKAEVQEALAEANRVLNEEENNNTTNSKVKKFRRKAQARVKHGFKILKIYKKGFIADAIGAVCVGTGLAISENGRTKALAGAAAIGGAFANYRAAVREDLGPEADIKYLGGKKAVNVPKKPKGKKGEVVEEDAPDDVTTAVKDPEKFRLLFSKENTPSVWSENYDMRISNLEWLEALLSKQYMSTWEKGGMLTLNDMRREFDANNPRKFDVDIGGLFGRIYERDKPETHKLINLHFREDKDFMDGLKDWCYVYFDCDPEPLIGRKRRRKFTPVES